MSNSTQWIFHFRCVFCFWKLCFFVLFYLFVFWYLFSLIFMFSFTFVSINLVLLQVFTAIFISLLSTCLFYLLIFFPVYESPCFFACLIIFDWMLDIVHIMLLNAEFYCLSIKSVRLRASSLSWVQFFWNLLECT